MRTRLPNHHPELGGRTRREKIWLSGREKAEVGERDEGLAVVTGGGGTSGVLLDDDEDEDDSTLA